MAKLQQWCRGSVMVEVQVTGKSGGTGSPEDAAAGIGCIQFTARGSRRTRTTCGKRGAENHILLGKNSGAEPFKVSMLSK